MEKIIKTFQLRQSLSKAFSRRRKGALTDERRLNTCEVHTINQSIVSFGTINQSILRLWHNQSINCEVWQNQPINQSIVSFWTINWEVEITSHLHSYHRLHRHHISIMIMVVTVLFRQPRPVLDLHLLEVTLDPSPPPRECHHHHDIDDDDDEEEEEEVDESDLAHEKGDFVHIMILIRMMQAGSQ